MRIPFSVFRGDKSQETVDLQGFDGFCPRVDTEDMRTVKSGDKFVHSVCLYGDKSPETVDLQGFDGFCPPRRY